MRQDKITNILVSILIVLALVIIFIQLQQSGAIDIKVNNAISGVSMKNGVDGKDGYTPVKGVDYFDGKNSISTYTTETVVKEVAINGKDGVDGKNGNDGLTPELRCNIEKNRWEVRYSQESIYEVLNGEPVRCTIEP